MITPYQLLQESGFAQYIAMVRFHYNRDNTSLGAEKIAEMVRAIPGATRVSTVSLDKEHGIGIFNVKIISMKPPKEAYQALKQNALERYQGLITGVEVGANTIETKGDFIIKENLRNLSESNLGQYLGQLLEEGLLLEVSIDELRRQWVESGKMDEETFNQVVQASNNQSNYATWLVKKVGTELINTEDLHLWSEIFTFFDRYKQRFQKKDINQVKTREDITAFIEDYNNVKDAVENQKSSGMNKSDAEKTDPCLLGKFKTSDGRKWTVYKTKPGQWKEERKIGSGTNWCTVASQHYFDSYLQRDPNPAYYIFINQKNPKEKYQIHYNSDQFKDKYDREVNREEDWALEFLEYLKERDGRTEVTPRTREAIQRKEDRKAAAKDLQQETRSVAPSFKVSEDDGNTVYKLDQNSNILGKGSVLDIAKLFVEVLSFSEDKALRFAERVNRWRDFGCLLKLSDGSFDIVKKDYQHELGSSPDCEMHLDSKLPKATEDNIRAYTDAASYLGASINPEVLIRTNKDLPSLDKFLVKSEGNQKVYKVGSTRNYYKALLQAGIGKYTLTSLRGDILIYEGPEMPPSCRDQYVCVSAENGSLIDVYPGQSPDELDRLYKFYENLKKLGFDFITGAEQSPSKTLNRAVFWHNQGGLEGVKQKIQAEAEDAPEGFPQGSKVGKSNTIKTILKLFTGYTEANGLGSNPVGFFTTDFSNYLVAFGARICHWHLGNRDIVALHSIATQKDIYEMKIDPEVLARFCQYFNADLPPALEKILARRRGGEHAIINVFKLLRHGLQQRSLRPVSLPIYRDRRNGNPYRVYTINGMYGTWEQIGPSIRESSPQYWAQINSVIRNHPEATADVLIYFNQDNPRHTWNAVIRLVENNIVIWYARRWGNGEGAQWNMRDVPEDIRVTVEGEPAIQNNFTAPEPPAPRRAARQPRQAQAAQPAAPVPELTPEQQQQIQQSRIQTQNAEEAYRFDAQHAQQGLAALGFTNISQELAGQPNNLVQAVVYRAHPHRGNTTHVALLYANNANTVVAGYPQNPTLAAAENCSTVWRRLTQQLDNSVRTFQQCHDICQELHIPIPPAIQGWLVYRGQ